MIYGVTHIELEVSSLAHARELYVTVAGLSVLAEGEAHLELDGGALPILLRRVPAPTPRGGLFLQASSVIAAFTSLRDAGARVVDEPNRTSDHHVRARLLDPDDNLLILWRALSEDELETPVELPCSLEWEPAARALLQSLLRHVPALFRPLARRSAVRAAEELASEHGLTVTEHLAARAYIRATPQVMRHKTHAPLRDQGYDPAAFSADYQA